MQQFLFCGRIWVKRKFFSGYRFNILSFALLRVSILAALAVSLVGVIGFIGLIAPHIARKLWGEDHRWYLPASACIGSAILICASVAAKLISSHIIIPVGIVTTLVGIPFFIIALMRRTVQ